MLCCHHEPMYQCASTIHNQGAAGPRTKYNEPSVSMTVKGNNGALGGGEAGHLFMRHGQLWQE